jgi:hypothetical protein
MFTVNRGVSPRRSASPSLSAHSAAGIESLIWRTGIAGLSRLEAAELMRHSAQALPQAALRDPSAGPA